MALNVDNIIGLSVAHGIDITTALIVILTYVGHRAYFWLFEKFASVWNLLITKVFCCGLSSRWIIRRQFLKDSSTSGSYAKTSLYLMLHICLVFNAVRVAGSAFHVARYSITTNYDFSKPPSEQVLTRKVHILNSIQNALFVVGLFLYSVIFSILILIWLQVVRTLQDLYDPKDHRSFGVIHHSVVKVLLVIVLSIEAVFVVPAIVTYSVPRQKLVDKRVIDWVVAYTCGPVFGLCIIFLITLATVLGVRILYLTYRANKNSASTESSESKRVLITKISISLIVFMITMIIQLVGVVLNGLGLPVWSTILFLQSLPELIGITMVMLIFSPFKLINNIWKFALSSKKKEKQTPSDEKQQSLADTEPTLEKVIEKDGQDKEPSATELACMKQEMEPVIEMETEVEIKIEEPKMEDTEVEATEVEDTMLEESGDDQSKVESV